MLKILMIAALACVLPAEARGEGPTEGDITWFVSGGGGERLSNDAGRLGTLALGVGLPTSTATDAHLEMRVTIGETSKQNILLGEFFGGIGVAILPVHSRGYVRGTLGFSMIEQFVKHKEGEKIPEEDVLERRFGAGLMLEAGFVLLPFVRNGREQGGLTLGLAAAPTYLMSFANAWRGSLIFEVGAVSW